MAFTYVNGASNSAASGTEASVTISGIGITNGDLIVVLVHSNNNGGTIADTTGSGAAFTTQIDSKTPSGETCSYSLLWKVASSEPTAYTFSHGGSAAWSVIVGCWTPATTPEVDVTPVHFIQTSAANTGLATTITPSADALGIAVFMDDDSQVPLIEVDQSYITVAVEGDRKAYMAYRIYTTSEASGTVTVSDMNISDKTYSEHMSFVEGAGASSIIPQAMHHYRNNSGSGL